MLDDESDELDEGVRCFQVWWPLAIRNDDDLNKERTAICQYELIAEKRCAVNDLDTTEYLSKRQIDLGQNRRSGVHPGPEAAALRSSTTIH